MVRSSNIKKKPKPNKQKKTPNKQTKNPTKLQIKQQNLNSGLFIFLVRASNVTVVQEYLENMLVCN